MEPQSSMLTTQELDVIKGPEKTSGRFSNISLLLDVNNVILMGYPLSLRQVNWFVHVFLLDFSFHDRLRVKNKGTHEPPPINHQPSCCCRTNYADTPIFYNAFITSGCARG